MSARACACMSARQAAKSPEAVQTMWKGYWECLLEAQRPVLRLLPGAGGGGRTVAIHRAPEEGQRSCFSFGCARGAAQGRSLYRKSAAPSRHNFQSAGTLPEDGRSALGLR